MSYQRASLKRLQKSVVTACEGGSAGHAARAYDLYMSCKCSQSFLRVVCIPIRAKREICARGDGGWFRAQSHQLPPPVHVLPELTLFRSSARLQQPLSVRQRSSQDGIGLGKTSRAVLHLPLF